AASGQTLYRYRAGPHASSLQPAAETYSAIDPMQAAPSRPRPCSNLHLAAELDHPVRRNAEKLRRRQRVAMHGLEQFAADGAKARASLRHNGHSAHEERGVHHVELKVLPAAALEHSRHVGVLHEAVIGDHGMEVVAEVDDLEALVGRDARN